MGVSVFVRVTKGWKADRNERFGEVFEIVFEHENNGVKKVLFRYAPKLEDRAVFERYFSLLEELDRNYMAVLGTVNKVERAPRVSCGDNSCVEVSK